jgi:hypothetical protein
MARRGDRKVERVVGEDERAARGERGEQLEN